MCFLIPIIILLYNLFFYVRLRDMSQETDQEHRKRISEMEKDVATVDRLEGLLAFLVIHFFINKNNAFHL